MFAVFFLFLLFLMFPETTSAGMKNGMQLLTAQVIPALYPFILLTTILKNLSSKNKLHSKLMLPLAFLSGYPLGAKIVAQNTKTSPKYKQILLVLCNNPSPAYMISFVGFQCLKDLKIGLLIYISVLLGNIFWTLVCFLYQKNKCSEKNKIKSTLRSCDASSISFDNIIMQTFTTMVNISSYILFFCLIAAFISKLSFLSQISHGILAGILEMTTGIQILAQLKCHKIFKIILITGLSSFGGLSVIAQTYSMIQGSSLSIKKYMTDKTITSVIAMSVMYLILYLFE